MNSRICDQRSLVVTCLGRFFARCSNLSKSLRSLWLGFVAALLVASKFGDPACWADREIVHMSCGMFSPGDVTKRGISLVIALGGAVGMPGVSGLGEGFTIATLCGPIVRRIASWVLELALFGASVRSRRPIACRSFSGASL